MKLSSAAAGAVALTLSIAVGQPRTEPNLKAAPEGQRLADTTAAQTVSVVLLRQPLSRKARQILEKAQHAADSGDHVSAIGFLESAHTKYPESDGWTQSMLGVEYLKTRQFAAALRSLGQAVLLLPDNAVDRSNLGFVLAATGQYDRAEGELRCALYLDHGQLKTRQLLDLVIAAEAPKPPAQSHSTTAPDVLCSK
jgi:tetratricopeptide (TPR) repeat protein